ncbi:MAG: hydrogenobyrinic acid a,c-diamide synthase (glutamine-hydrolyzing) [Methanomassiliicoccales archaeon]|nr:MAG: hydrogenobyrinic acid a,c-diamide synthase (glutamine-hydrolyzing) [Methanomassiliicoccales archaeon]
MRPRVMIAGERSGVGKTTVTLGLLAALKARGLEVQPFKVGPDFLDPMHHDMVCSRRSRNLDTWMFPSYVMSSFLRASKGADISVIEGVMGFYDGYDGISEEGSSAHLSKLLSCPVVLVLNASSSARSLGAVAMGFKEYDKDVEIAGVVFNNVGGRRHLSMLESSLRGVECLGGLPKAKDIGLESRHLGLIPAREGDNSPAYEGMRALVEEHLDVKRIIEIARSAKNIEDVVDDMPSGLKRCRIGVALDAAFNFYYVDNFEILRSLGAEIIEFSPLADELPDVDGLYFGGGYPEVFAQGLSSNLRMMAGVRRAADDGMPIYAECGGLMYMCSSLRDLHGRTYKMTGIFDAEVEMTERLQALGYVRARTLRPNLLSDPGEELRGHVFHYSRVTRVEGEMSYELDKDKGIVGGLDGLCHENILASYLHLHFGSAPKAARRFVERCVEHSRR